MIVSQEDAVEVTCSCAKHLAAEIWPAINQYAEPVYFKKCRRAETLVAGISAPADGAVASDDGYSK